MFAIVEIAGKQHKVEVGQTIETDIKKDVKEGDTLKWENVLLTSDGSTLKVGTPYVKGVSVEGKVKTIGKGEKINAFIKKPKKRFERHYGHRQSLMWVEITKIA